MTNKKIVNSSGGGQPNYNKVDIKHKMYLDYLRVLSALAVVVIHVLGDKYYYCVEFKSAAWYYVTIFGSLVRFAVPIFFMISGALFLNPNKNVSTKRLWLKNILRLVVSFFVWDVLYAFISTRRFFAFSFGYAKLVFNSVASFKYHLWFIPSLVFLYMLTPVFRCITTENNKKVVKYLLILNFVAICISSVLNFASLFNIPDSVAGFIKLFAPLDLLGNFSFYFFAGYYFDNYTFSNFKTKFIIWTGLIALVLSPIINVVMSFVVERGLMLNGNNFNVLTCVTAVGLFLLFKNCKICNKENKFIKNCSGCSYGIYLIHVFIILEIQKIIPQNIALSNWMYLYFPAAIVVTFFVSYLITYLIKLIFRKHSKWFV